MTVFKTLKLILISLLHVLIQHHSPKSFHFKNSLVLLLNKQVLTSGGMFVLFV